MKLPFLKRAFTSASEQRRANLFSWRASAAEAKPRRGFTLLLAVLISSILVALGSAIFDIVSKEIRLSSFGRESQFAFYSADTGIECALYWDFKRDAFSTSSPTSMSISCGGGDPVAIDSDNREVTGQGTPNEQIVTTFSFPIGGMAEENPCASVRVTRRYYPSYTTTIESFGYNTCVQSDPLRLERAIRVSY